MNKRLISVLLAALLLAALLPAAAFAESGIIVNLGFVRAGEALDLQMATTASGTAALSGGSLPDNCSIVTEDRGGSSAHYLRGTPGLAGSYEFTLTVTETVVIVPIESGEESGGEDPGEEGTEPETPPEPTEQSITVATLTCSITVLPDIPSFTVQDVESFVAEQAKIPLQASVRDSGTLSYQWYFSSVKDNKDGQLLENKTERELDVNTEFVGPSYYYCVITNSNNGLTESVTTPAVTVNVIEPTILSVAINSLPTKLEYTEGDSLDTKGLTLLVQYSNGMAVTDDEGFTVSPEKLTSVGTQTITVTYQNNTVTFPVIVKEEEEKLEGIAVTSLPVKREYRQGERLDLTGLVVESITNKGKHSPIASGYSCSPEILSVAGVQTVTVSYEDKTTSFTVTVLAGEKTVQRIEIQTLPNKLSYQVGDSFDSSGLVLRVVTDQGDETVRSGFSCNPSRFTRDGAQTVTVSYGGQSCTLEVNVAPAAEQPATTERPGRSGGDETVTVIDRTGSPSRDSGDSQQARRTLLLVIIFLALVALVALLAYLYVAKKDDLRILWQRLTHRDEDEDDDYEDRDE